MCRGMSAPAADSSWQQIAPIDGYTTVGSGRKPVFIVYVPRSWSPSLLTIDRIRLIEPISSAVRPRPGASCRPLTAVSMAPVPPAMRVSGWGSNVSSWLGPPCIQSMMIDWAWSRGVPGASAARASTWLIGASARCAEETGDSQESASGHGFQGEFRRVGAAACKRSSNRCSRKVWPLSANADSKCASSAAVGRRVSTAR